jgi:hypothetical protein
MCLVRHNGQPVVMAYASRATSAVVPLASGGGAPLTVRVGVTGSHPLLAVSPPVGSSQIDLRIRDTTGAPIEGAEIEVDGWAYTSATTNTSGRLTLNDLPAGTTILDIWRPGYARQRLAVDLAPKRVHAVDVRLVTDEPGRGGQH